MRTTARFFVAAILATFATLALACSSSSSSTPTPCNQDPYTCAAGKTCWTADQSGTFSCLTSGAGKKGDKCLNTPGAPTCGDRLACLQLTTAGGTCVSYCDPSRQGEGCDSGETCMLAGLQGTNQTFHVCVGGSPAQGDAGGD
jgi:hypothetical protein